MPLRLFRGILLSSGLPKPLQRRGFRTLPLRPLSQSRTRKTENHPLGQLAKNPGAYIEKIQNPVNAVEHSNHNGSGKFSEVLVTFVGLLMIYLE